MYNSGSVEVSVRGYNFTVRDVTTTIAGLFNDLSGAINTGKPVFITNCHYFNFAPNPIPAVIFFTDNTKTNILVSTSLFSFEVTSSDLLTVRWVSQYE